MINLYGDQIILDDETSPAKVAILNNGKLIEFLSLLPSSVPQIGSVHIVRIQQIFKQHRLANAKLEDGTNISVRLSNQRLSTGSLALATITTEPWDNKPGRAILGAELAGRYVILLPQKPEIIRTSKNRIKNKDTSISGIDLIASALPENCGIILRRQALDAPFSAIKEEIKILWEDWQKNSIMPFYPNMPTSPKKIYPGLSLLQLASIIAPNSRYRICKDDGEWQAFYDHFDKVNQPYFLTDRDVCIWVQSTKGLTAIDVDSAGSKLSPPQLIPHIAETIMNHIRLRQLSGAIFVDMPRLLKVDKIKFHELCSLYALADIRHPDIYGYGPAGLLEMTVRHRHMTLENRIKLMSSHN